MRMAFDYYDGKTPAIDRNTPAFGDYVGWLNRQDRDSSLEFWRCYFEGMALAPDQSIEDNAQLDEFRANLDEKLVSMLDEFARSRRLTRPTPLATAWALTLVAETGATDIALGHIASNRLPPFQNTLGPLIATLPIRYRSDSALPLEDWLRRLQQDLHDALNHAAIGLADIQRAVSSESGGSLISALFGYDVGDDLNWRTSDFEIDRLIRHGSTGLPLSLVILDQGGCLQFILGYDSGRHNEARIERMFARFQYFLQQLCSNHDRPLNGLSLLLPGELAPSGTFQRKPDALPTVLDLVLSAVDQFPNRDAIVVDGDSIAYAQMRRRAGQIAATLAANGVGAASKVGLFTSRGVDMIPAMLGIWWLGAVYLPFDPSHPAARTRVAARQADLDCLLADGATIGDAEAIGAPRLLDISSISANAPALNDRYLIGPEDLAYLLFTSGSTGKPNGVPIDHRGLGNILQSMSRRPGFDADDRMLASTTVAFDVSMIELLLPICVGGTVYLATDAQLADPARINELVHEVPLTVQFATPALWETLLLAGWRGNPGLRCWSGGDTLRQDIAHAILDSGHSLWNLFGPTETAIWSAMGEIVDVDDINVGVPVDNTQTMVIDNVGRALPPGVPGELLIGGAGLSAGYLENADLSEERFVTREGERFFRTGDLALYTEEGLIRHFGRLDRQIKLRGFRIEPGEIENVINNLPGVESSHVMLREIGGDPRLVAYLVSKSEFKQETLIQALRRSLPEYMLPSSMLRLDALPLTSSGKVDRRGLPPPQPAVAVEVEAFSADENALAELWQSLLGVPVHSSGDDFFALGGHSLLVARLAGQIEQRFDRQIGIRALMTSTRLGDQARLLRPDSQPQNLLVEYGYLVRRPSVFFAWHEPNLDAGNEVVMLVPPLLNEVARIRLLYRELALELQRRGKTVLRFDYQGHGNSAGDVASLRIGDFCNDIAAAAYQVRERRPHAALSLISSRFGASLATEALDGFETRNWITLDPVYRGEDWLKDLEAWRRGTVARESDLTRRKRIPRFSPG